MRTTQLTILFSLSIKCNLTYLIEGNKPFINPKTTDCSPVMPLVMLGPVVETETETSSPTLDTPVAPVVAGAFYSESTARNNNYNTRTVVSRRLCIISKYI